MKDNENNLREGGRQDDQELPLNLKICSSNPNEHNFKESKTPSENESSQEDSSFQNTNFVRIKFGLIFEFCLFINKISIFIFSIHLSLVIGYLPYC